MAQRFTPGNPSRVIDTDATRRLRRFSIERNGRRRALRGWAHPAAALACALMFGLIVVTPAAATDCGDEALGTGRVTQTIDARTLLLSDGRAIRLAGIAPPPDSAAAAAVLAKLTVDREVVLRGDSDAPDRHGRQHAFVMLAGTATSVQSLLLRAGAAWLAGTLPAGTCAAELTAAETAAREAGLGLWNAGDVIKNAERPGDILARLGQFTLVEGTVASARQAGATLYLNFGRRWTRDFAVIIPRRMIGLLVGTGIDARTLAGRKVRVRGWVEQHGGPRIALHGTGQITVLDRH